MVDPVIYVNHFRLVVAHQSMIVPVFSCRARFGRVRVSRISNDRFDSLRLGSEQRFRWRVLLIEMRVYRFGHRLGPPI